MNRVLVLLSFSLLFFTFIFILLKNYLNFSSIVWGRKEETKLNRRTFCNWDYLCWKSQVGLWGNYWFFPDLRSQKEIVLRFLSNQSEHRTYWLSRTCPSSSLTGRTSSSPTPSSWSPWGSDKQWTSNRPL